MPTTTSALVATKLEATFARYGIAKQVISNNGPQFSSAKFKALAHELDFQHITSSPQHPQGNGHAERAVQITKRILKQKDPLLVLMCYRSTLHSSTGASPAELLMGWRIRTTLPTLNRNLLPKWQSRQCIKAKNAAEKGKQTHYYNQHHGARTLSTFQPGDRVFTKLENPSAVTNESVTQVQPH